MQRLEHELPRAAAAYVLLNGGLGVDKMGAQELDEGIDVLPFRVLAERSADDAGGAAVDQIELVAALLAAAVERADVVVAEPERRLAAARVAAAADT